MRTQEAPAPYDPLARNTKFHLIQMPWISKYIILLLDWITKLHEEICIKGFEGLGIQTQEKTFIAEGSKTSW